MGSVQDYIECLVCKEDLFSDFYYKTGEEYLFCEHCGYSYSARYKRDEYGVFVTKDGTENFSFSNLILETDENHNPYGAYKIKFKSDNNNQFGGGAIEVGALENVDEWNDIFLEVMRNKHEIEEFNLNRFVDGCLIKKKII